MEGPSPQGPSLFHQGLTISMTLISDGWPRRLAVSLQRWTCASRSLPSYLLYGLLCCPGWTLLPVFMASSCVHCPGHDLTLSCSTLLKWLTLSLFLGGDTVALPYHCQHRASSSTSCPGLAVEIPIHPLHLSGLGRPGGPPISLHTTVPKGEINEGAASSETKSSRTCKGFFFFCKEMRILALSWVRDLLPELLLLLSPKPKVLVVSWPLVSFLERFPVKLPPKGMNLKIIMAVITVLTGCQAIHTQDLIQSLTHEVGTVIIPILWMAKSRIKDLVQGHGADAELCF